MTPKELWEFRQLAELSQKQLARYAGVSVNSVARWERGELGMSRTTQKFLEILRVMLLNE